MFQFTHQIPILEFFKNMHLFSHFPQQNFLKGIRFYDLKIIPLNSAQKYHMRNVVLDFFLTVGTIPLTQIAMQRNNKLIGVFSAEET